MPDFSGIFAALKPVLAEEEGRLAVRKDTPSEFSLVTKGPSPFPQHKGRPMWFGAVKLGKAYVSFHLMPLYLSPTLEKEISPSLKKRMQGKTCFNFKAVPDKELLADLRKLTAACAAEWDNRFHFSAADSWFNCAPKAHSNKFSFPKSPEPPGVSAAATSPKPNSATSPSKPKNSAAPSSAPAPPPTAHSINP